MKIKKIIRVEQGQQTHHYICIFICKKGWALAFEFPFRAMPPSTVQDKIT